MERPGNPGFSLFYGENQVLILYHMNILYSLPSAIYSKYCTQNCTRKWRTAVGENMGENSDRRFTISYLKATPANTILKKESFYRRTIDKLLQRVEFISRQVLNILTVFPLVFNLQQIQGSGIRNPPHLFCFNIVIVDFIRVRIFD